MPIACSTRRCARSDWAIERNAVLNEIDGDASSPFFNLLSRVRAAAFPDQPSGRTPLGSRDDVARATVADIARYYREWYAPNNATLVIAGDVNHATAFAKAQRYFGAIPSQALPPKTEDDIRFGARARRSKRSFRSRSKSSISPTRFPGDTQRGEPAVSTLSTLIENQRSPFYRALVQSNIALAIEANADTQLRGGLLNVFIILNPGSYRRRGASASFKSTLDSGARKRIRSGSRRRRKTPDDCGAPLLAADSIDGIGDLAGYTYGIVGEKIADEDDRLAALTGSTICSPRREPYLQPPDRRRAT